MTDQDVEHSRVTVRVSVPDTVARWVQRFNPYGWAPYAQQRVLEAIHRDCKKEVDRWRATLGLGPLTPQEWAPLAELLADLSKKGFQKLSEDSSRAVLPTDEEAARMVVGSVWEIEFDSVGTPVCRVVLVDAYTAGVPWVAWAPIVRHVPDTPLTPVVAVPGTDGMEGAVVVPWESAVHPSVFAAAGARLVGHVTADESAALLTATELCDVIDEDEDGDPGPWEK